jgi:hypothetical protein
VDKKSPLSAFLTAILIGGLVLASAMRFGTVQASTGDSGIPKPSVPEFTLKIVDTSYDVAPYTHTDPYSGESWTEPGYHVKSRDVQITIKNQPFSAYTDESGNYIGLFYKVSYKGHYEDTWRYWPEDTYGYEDFSNLYAASGSDYTTISISLFNWPEIGTGDKMDYRLEARIGYYSYDQSGPFTALETSGWSDTQTITIGEAQAPTPSPATTPTPAPTPTPTPTPTPSEEPQQTEQIEPIVGSAIVVAVIVAVLGLFIYLIKRK